MTGLRHHLLAAVSACVLAGMLGCGSSTSTNTQPATDADVKNANLVIGSMVAHATQNDASAVVTNPRVMSVLLSFNITAPDIIRALNADPRHVNDILRTRAKSPTQLSDGRRLVARRAGVASDTTFYDLPTGTWKIYPDSGSAPVPLSAVPHNGLLIISANSDSTVDSVRVANVHYGVIQNSGGGYERLPDSLVMDVYAAHPVMTSNHHVGHIGFGLPIVAPGIPAGVRFSMDEPDVSTFSMGVALDYAHNIYTLSVAVSDLVLHTSASLTTALHFSGDPLSGGTLTQMNYTGSHTYSGNTWQNVLNFTSIYMDTNDSNADTAVVSGTIKENGVTAATIAGVLKTPVPPDSCPPVYVTVTSTGHVYPMCQVYGDLSFDLGGLGIGLSPARQRWSAPARFAAWRR